MLRFERPKPSQTRRRRIFEGAELEQTIATAQEPWRTLFTIAALTGARVSELLALTWCEVSLDDLDEDQLDFAWQVARQGAATADEDRRLRAHRADSTRAGADPRAVAVQEVRLASGASPEIQPVRVIESEHVFVSHDDERSDRRHTVIEVAALSESVQNYGEIFTRRWVVDVILDLTAYVADNDLGALRLVEPSCGTGAFLGPAIERLLKSAEAHGRSIESLGDAVRAYDLQAGHVHASRALCHEVLCDCGASAAVADHLAERWVHHADFLLDQLDATPANVVVGNPPYIRYDDLSEVVAAAYRASWSTMRGRGDIYIGFFERALGMLAPDGRLGFICADRWMRNQYGAGLRALVANGYAIEHVWTMHDVDAFEASVSAYPAITVIANRPQGSVVAADTTSNFGEHAARELVSAAARDDFSGLIATGVQAHCLPHWFSGDELWPTGSPGRLALIELLGDRFRPLQDARTGTRVSIGVATGADSVYVVKDPTIVESDRVVPLAMRQDLVSGDFDWHGHYVINPWDDDGRLVDLADYPQLSAYLAEHPILRDRHVAKRNPETWHRTIDKVHVALTPKQKLLLQDMKAHINPVLEAGGHYPHHNLYYVVSDRWDLEVLGGILLSRIAQAFIEAYCVRMRGGTLRFQAQYLKKIRVPAPDTLSNRVAEDLRAAFRGRDVVAATRAAASAYGINLDDYDLGI